MWPWDSAVVCVLGEALRPDPRGEHRSHSPSDCLSPCSHVMLLSSSVELFLSCFVVVVCLNVCFNLYSWDLNPGPVHNNKHAVSLSCLPDVWTLTVNVTVLLGFQAKI